MAARLLLHEKVLTGHGDLTETVVWSVPRTTAYSLGVRYRLAFVPGGAGRPAVLYDNHHPKGPHRHREGREEPYEYVDIRRLRLDFERDVARWRETRREL
jgi:hypothetical protein